MDCVVKPLNHVGDSYMVVAWLIEKNTYFFFLCTITVSENMCSGSVAPYLS